MDMGRDPFVSQWHDLREHGICASFKNRYEQVKKWITSEPRRHFLLSGFWFYERRLRDQGGERRDNCVGGQDSLLCKRLDDCMIVWERTVCVFVIPADPCDD